MSQNASAASQCLSLKSETGEVRKLIFAMYFILVLVIAGSTYLHHFQPQILQVPYNKNVSEWKNPAFNQSLIYERMTSGERQRVLADGVPQGTDILFQSIVDIGLIFSGFLCYFHARRHYGDWMASCFLIGSVIFTGIQESIWILSGRYLGGIFSFAPGGKLLGTYWFTKGVLWFIETPMFACLGWFVIAYSCVWIAGIVFPKLGLWGRATVGGLIAMGLDLWTDPVCTSPEIMNWVWAKGDFVLFLGIPIYNFIAWFFLIFLFAILWEKLPELKERYDKNSSMIMFLSICCFSPFIIAIFIFGVWFGIAGNIFSTLGITSVIQIPPGW